MEIFNSVSLATRVRIEVLWAMAERILNDKETATVLGYSSRPTLQVKDKEDLASKGHVWSQETSLSWICLCKMLKEGDLVSAYKKAGTAFAGQLQ